jgi:malonate transporter and related proteins
VIQDKFFLSILKLPRQGLTMIQTLQIVLPVFLIIAMGFAAVRSGLLRESVGDGLSDFVFIVAIPVLLFRTLATARMPEVQPWFYWAAYYSALGIVWAMTTVLARRFFHLSGQETPIASFTAVQSNTVFIGIPLILQAFGEAGTVPMFLMIAVHLPLTMTLAMLLIERNEGSDAGFIGLFRKLLLNPILIGIGAGVAWRLSGFTLPSTIDATARLLGEAAGPTALFSLGMTLSRYGLAAPGPQLATLSVLKLLVQPAIVYVLAFHVFPMPPLWAAVAVLFAACPTGVNAYLLAQRYNTGVALSSSVVALTTAMAVVTTTWWVWLVSELK